jgi:methyltransferase OMS1
VQVLQQACKLLKPGGKLLLLEHGKSTWGWLNSHMDEKAAGHYRQYGCWYNRDILDIVQQVKLMVGVTDGEAVLCV